MDRKKIERWLDGYKNGWMEGQKKNRWMVEWI